MSWTPEPVEFAKPKRVWAGLTPKQTEEVTRGALDRACCPDCWRWHLDGYRNTNDGHCWSCMLEIRKPGAIARRWEQFQEWSGAKSTGNAPKTALKPLGQVPTPSNRF